MQTHDLLLQNSGQVEWYTPPPIIAAARAAMGSIDLDPASCEQANDVVAARQYYTRAQDGLVQPWFGNVWMNHPYGRNENPRWVMKLMGEYWASSIHQACALVFASTSEKWFQPLLGYPICFIQGRIRHGSPDSRSLTASTKGSAVVYLGYDTDRFADSFKTLGKIVMPYQHKF